MDATYDQWEYDNTDIDKDSPNKKDLLNAKGRAGWEMVSVVAYGRDTKHVFYWKRLKKKGITSKRDQYI